MCVCVCVCVCVCTGGNLLHPLLLMAYKSAQSVQDESLCDWFKTVPKNGRLAVREPT